VEVPVEGKACPKQEAARKESRIIVFIGIALL
jgi:hypothetical protein